MADWSNKAQLQNINKKGVFSCVPHWQVLCVFVIRWPSAKMLLVVIHYSRNHIPIVIQTQRTWHFLSNIQPIWSISVEGVLISECLPFRLPGHPAFLSPRAWLKTSLKDTDSSIWNAEVSVWYVAAGFLPVTFFFPTSQLPYIYSVHHLPLVSLHLSIWRFPLLLFPLCSYVVITRCQALPCVNLFLTLTHSDHFTWSHRQSFAWSFHFQLLTHHFTPYCASLLCARLIIFKNKNNHLFSLCFSFPCACSPVVT